jgi:transcriptional regulator with XRE-family HTH domain
MILGMTQEKLAEKAGITKQTISMAEQGKRETGVWKIAKIARALDVSTYYLIEGKSIIDDMVIFNSKITGFDEHQSKVLEVLLQYFTETDKVGFGKPTEL